MVGAAEPLRRNRDFVILWLGETFSEAGTAMSALVFPLLGYAITGSPVAAGAVASVETVGRVLVRFISGALVDRWSRRRVLVMANIAAAAAFAVASATALAGLLRLPELMVVALIAGTAEAFIQPAAAAAVRSVVPKEQLAVALARMQGRDHVAQLVGPPLGGALFTVAHGLPLAVDAASYAIFAVASGLLRDPMRAVTGTTGRLLSDARAGFAFVWRHATLRALMIWGGVFNFATGFVFVALTLRLLRAGVHPAAIGSVQAAAAIAGLAGSFLAPTLVRRMRTGVLTMTTTALMAAVTAPMAFTTNVVAVGVLAAAATFLVPANNSGISGYLSASTPHAMLARMFAAGGILSMALATAAPTAGGAVLGWTGGTVTLLIGAVLIALTITPLLTSPEVLRLGTPEHWPLSEGATGHDSAPGEQQPARDRDG
jgi:predicted MFS family arabinose efflux permease